MSNYLPSAHAAIEGNPQQYIWRIIVTFQFSIRLLFAAVFFNQYFSYTVRWNVLYKALVFLNTAFLIVEIFSSMIVSYVSSVENDSKLAEHTRPTSL